MNLERANLAAAIAATLQDNGYVTEADGAYRLNIKDAAGYLGTLKLSGTHTFNGILIGSIIFDPVSYRSSEGRYHLKNGTINIRGLLARLRAEIPKAQALRVEREASKVREAKDRAILNKLLDCVGPIGEDTVSVRVFDGLVDISLTDITPEDARRVLDALRGGR